MIKKIIKNKLALLAQKFTKFCVHRGCISQDELIEKLTPIMEIKTDTKPIYFFCPGKVPTWRVRTFYEKEPETIEWMNSFDKNSLYFDVGANIGLYSIYAGMKNHTVLAIEPMAHNYFILQKNININQLENVTAYCACLYDKMLIDSLKVRNDGWGQAENSFDEPIDTFEYHYDFAYQQGMIGLPLDYFSKKFGFPQYIKIDVDGHELKVLQGSLKTLAYPNVKSILIELNELASNYKKTCDLIKKHGFVLESKSNSKMLQNTKYKNVRNHIFCKK